MKFNIKIELILIIYAICFVAFGEEEAYVNRHCFIFSPLKLIREESYRDELNMYSQYWIDIDQTSGICVFTVNDASSQTNIKRDVEFSNIEPLNSDAYNCATNIWPTYIVCQWDQEEGKRINSDEEVNGDLLKTYLDCEENKNTPQNDEDTYVFRPTCENYCIEITNDSEVDIFVYSQAGTCPNTPIQFDQTFNKNTKKELNSGSVKRFYKSDWIKNQDYIIKVSSLQDVNNYYATKHEYSFTIKKVRPLVLVHGICAGPTREGTNDTTFGEIPSALHLCADCPPVKVFDFPWDSENKHYTYYCNGYNSLSKYVSDNCIEVYDLLPVLIAHSMGGILTIKQIESEDEFIDNIDKFIFFGTPFCGADKANYYDFYDFIFYHLVSVFNFVVNGVNDSNLQSLRRGTQEMWDRIDNIPKSFKNKDVTYFSGSTTYFYLLAGEDSDIVVSKSSANLKNTLEINQNDIPVNLNHIFMKSISFPCKGEYEKVLNKIIDYINH